jgi:hypothetical protein
VPRSDEIDLLEPTVVATDASQTSQDTHQAFIDGIEICAERFPRDEERRIACFAEVASVASGRRPSERTGTPVPADTLGRRRRGSAHAHAALRAKRAAKKAASEQTGTGS